MGAISGVARPCYRQRGRGLPELGGRIRPALGRRRGGRRREQHTGFRRLGGRRDAGLGPVLGVAASGSSGGAGRARGRGALQQRGAGGGAEQLHPAAGQGVRRGPGRVEPADGRGQKRVLARAGEGQAGEGGGRAAGARGVDPVAPTVARSGLVHRGRGRRLAGELAGGRRPGGEAGGRLGRRGQHGRAPARPPHVDRGGGPRPRARTVH
mmetsp:Transcript_42573/g.128651  ORF Transcript_42573/g.128651 Transcript_42573/m.128651 type:complete len:210 (+) Transcript_42573:458-1087(+)